MYSVGSTCAVFTKRLSPVIKAALTLMVSILRPMLVPGMVRVVLVPSGCISL